jgi:foldase protein PrsA
MLKSAFTILAIAGSGLFAQDARAARPVATVDGRVIEQRAFDHWMVVAARATGVADAVPPDRDANYRRCVADRRKAADARTVPNRRLWRQCKEEYERLRDLVMQLLISFEWLEGEAALRNLVVTEAEVTKAFERQKRQSFPKESDFKAFLESSGQTRADLRRRIRLDLLANRIREQVVAGHDQVTEQQIQQFYAENKARFVEPERRSLRIVLTARRSEAQRARKALERGASWTSVARRYSIDGETRRKGGRLRDVPEGELDRPLEKAAFRADKGRLVGPVRTDYGYYVLTVTEIEPERQLELPEVRTVIRDALVEQAQQEALDAFTRDFTARWRQKTECAKDYRTTDCRNGPPPEAIRRTGPLA